jgi:hypothetical protein
VDEEQMAETHITNVTVDGTPFDLTTIRRVWEKARKQPGFETFSLDSRGTTIGRFEYGRRTSYGWIIHRVVPPQNGGTDDIENLQPLHWKYAERPSDPLAPPSPHPS